MRKLNILALVVGSCCYFPYVRLLFATMKKYAVFLKVLLASVGFTNAAALASGQLLSKELKR